MPDEKTRTFGYSEEVLEALLKLLAPFEDITRDNMFGFPSFRASGQIFACVYEKGISLKMPKAAADVIVQTAGISPFIPFGRARMRQWIHIERKKVSAMKKDLPLIEASIHYVRTLKSRGAVKKSAIEAKTSKKAATEKKSARKTDSAQPKLKSSKPTVKEKPAGKTSGSKPSSSSKSSGKKASPKKAQSPKKATPKKAGAKKKAPPKKAPKKTASKAAPKKKKAAGSKGKTTAKRRK